MFNILSAAYVRFQIYECWIMFSQSTRSNEIYLSQGKFFVKDGPT